MGIARLAKSAADPTQTLQGSADASRSPSSDDPAVDQAPQTINDRRCSYKWVGSELPGEGCFVGLTSVTPDLKRTDFLAR